MTGFEYSTAALMLYAGMIREGVECFHNIRSRYDGEKRNPWDEAECGHHYARAMASWSGILALSGFRYRGREAAITAVPRTGPENFHCFWSTATGWGTFSLAPQEGGGTRFALRVSSGTLPCRSFEIQASGGAASTRLNGNSITHQMERRNERVVIRFAGPVTVEEGGELELTVHA